MGKQNPLLDRKQCSIQVLHPDSGNISKAKIKEALAQKLKSSEERISVFGMQTKFGGGRSSGFALIYASAESKRKFDSKTMCKRDGSSARDLREERLLRKSNQERRRFGPPRRTVSRLERSRRNETTTNCHSSSQTCR